MAPGAQPTPLASTSSTIIGSIAESIFGGKKDCADKAVNNNNNNEPGTGIPLVESKTKDSSDVPPPTPQNTTVTPELNEKVRNLIEKSFNKLRTNLNVLVLGSNSSGKTSLINSMNMAFHQEWKDRARYCPGRKHLIQECVVFRNRSRGANVTFFDTRGFTTIHEDSQAEIILRYILEGRIDTKCLGVVLLQAKEDIKRKYPVKTINPRKRIDLVLFVSDLTQEPNRHLMCLVEKAISASKFSSIHNVPILSVCTNADLVKEIPTSEKLNEYNLDLLRCQRRHQECPYIMDDLDLAKVTGRRPVMVIDNYRNELELWSDGSLNPSEVKPDTDRDSRLLAIWNEIVQSTAACGGGEKREYSPARRTTLGCLPFSFNYAAFRLRSASI